MTPEYTLYLNGYYFDTLATPQVFGDRPEPYRSHEKSLWTIYQLLKLGEHELTITDQAKQPRFRTKNAQEFKRWITAAYPLFADQLDQPIYTQFPHPNDAL
ncbi:MAG TPA: hypothetical protein VF690_17720 [Hymenobacter sp.]